MLRLPEGWRPIVRENSAHLLKKASFLKNIGKFCDYDRTEIHNRLIGKEGGRERGHHQLGDYDSTEIHNHLFGKEENTEMCRPAA